MVNKISTFYVFRFNNTSSFYILDLTKEQWSIILWVVFLHKELNKNIVIPNENKLNYQDFLNSWDEKDLPEWIKLEDLTLPKK